MDRPPNPAKEEAESVNPGGQGLPVSDSSRYVRSKVVRPYVDKFVVVFIDDILVYSKDT